MTDYKNLLLPAALSVILIAGCAGDGLQTGKTSITEADLVEDITVLASDDFEGRFPGTPGGEKTEQYLKQEFEKLGLKPGNGASYFQEVPLVEITADPSADLVVSGSGRIRSFEYGREFVGGSRRVVESVNVDQSDLVFVGYGIVAPEYDWDDYAGTDATGKTVVILVNDPGFATQDPDFFGGNAMTYYGRWTYKFEEAARHGAAGAVIIHETKAAGYPWGVVQNGWTGPQSDLVRDDNNMSRCAVEGWIQESGARTLFEMAGKSYESLVKQAASRKFRAVPLGLSASVSIENSIRRSSGSNVLALVEGSKRPEEIIIYMGHSDHLGKDDALEGDQIYNGARDNAMGTAALIELAEAFKSMPSQPERSILFLAVTAEEQGLLGSAFYAANPVYPLDKTVAAINIDAAGIWGRTRDVTIVGLGNSDLDSYITRAVENQSREVKPEAEVEKGFYFRSDQFSFAKVGVPSLYIDNGNDSVEHGLEWGLEQSADWTAKHYHQPSDEYNDTWDLSGFVEDLQAVLEVGYVLAGETSFPEWSERSAFKSIRERYMTSGE
jgi:Zn-dependent M28 family amino/carboxypeptidase